jgi:hypothetical protein
VNDFLFDTITYVDMHLTELEVQYAEISIFIFILTIICMRFFVSKKRKKSLIIILSQMT